MTSSTIKGILAIMISIIIISIIVEGLDVLLVYLISGNLPDENNPDEFLETRNHPLFLFIKLIYTAFSFVLGGIIVGYGVKTEELKFGILLGILQTFFLIFGYISFGDTAPLMFWILIILLAFPLIYLGNKFYINTYFMKNRSKN